MLFTCFIIDFPKFVKLSTYLLPLAAQTLKLDRKKCNVFIKYLCIVFCMSDVFIVSFDVRCLKC